MECNLYQTVKNVGISRRKIVGAVHYVLKNQKKGGNVSVHCVGDKKMMGINKKYRGVDGTTDVLAFAAQEGDGFFLEEEKDWGDIFINVDNVKHQAAEAEVPYTEEFFRMLVHALLHAFGYDHLSEEGAEAMFGLQEKLLAEIVNNQS